MLYFSFGFERVMGILHTGLITSCSNPFRPCRYPAPTCGSSAVMSTPTHFIYSLKLLSQLLVLLVLQTVLNGREKRFRDAEITATKRAFSAFSTCPGGLFGIASCQGRDYLTNKPCHSFNDSTRCFTGWL